MTAIVTVLPVQSFLLTLTVPLDEVAISLPSISKWFVSVPPSNEMFSLTARGPFPVLIRRVSIPPFPLTTICRMAESCTPRSRSPEVNSEMLSSQGLSFSRIIVQNSLALVPSSLRMPGSARFVMASGSLQIPRPAVATYKSPFASNVRSLTGALAKPWPNSVQIALVDEGSMAMVTPLRPPTNTTVWSLEFFTTRIVSSLVSQKRGLVTSCQSTPPLSVR